MQIQGHTIFEEHQKFRQWWLWALLLLTPLIEIIVALFADVKGPTIASTFFVIPVIVFVFILRLDTVLTNEGVYVRFFPFAIKYGFYPWTEIQHAYVRKYNPLVDYGGWGLRFGKDGRALNVKGNMGLQLILNNGKKLLIGTSQANELEQCLMQLSARKDPSIKTVSFAAPVS